MMRNAHYTRQERTMLLWLRLLTGACFLIALLFIFLPNYPLDYLNRIGAVFFNFSSPPLIDPFGDFWWVLSIVYLLILGYAAFLAQLNWMRFHNMVPLIIWAKALAAAGLLGLSYFRPEHFFYIVGGGLDGLICLITLYAYFKALKSRTFTVHTR